MDVPEPKTRILKFRESTRPFGPRAPEIDFFTPPEGLHIMAICIRRIEKYCAILSENFISYARKPQAFKPGDEWHPFGAKRRPFPACLAWSKVMTDMVEA